MWFYPQQEPRELSPLVLAYIGDAVYELYVRSFLVSQGRVKVDQLHREATALVNAGAQARCFHRLEELLTDEEKNIVRRGRNAKTSHVPKNAEMIDYHLSTGFEALLGYLFLTGQEERLKALITRLLSTQNPDVPERP
ncbi:MAG TPA: Mini-ribonuclease 3 [Peptococcaceae bacterium]|nr:Mini-ribonuclease 3 [Peptococcaceae bacterium]HPZ72131.1 Mini-ribonuclease 3 [Peptococcaceae bacterium]HQD54838.1 Mini-ribonuclease 3 [Peptococcaceae bacterium]